jgi:hypothetical protein
MASLASVRPPYVVTVVGFELSLDRLPQPVVVNVVLVGAGGDDEAVRHV